MAGHPRDPRSEAEKARAALARNDAMGLGVPESPMESRPSVTPQTFGDTTEAARIRSGVDQGLEAGGVHPATHDAAGSQSPAEGEQVTAGRDRSAPASSGSDPVAGHDRSASASTTPHREANSDDDVLSRAKE
jgi:hypothetical protein